MPSFADSAVIFILALILFGPKKLPQLARQLGKLMAEFRRASNEFRMQMEDELRIEEQKEHQAKVDAMAGPSSTTPQQAELPAGEVSPAESYHQESQDGGNLPTAENTPIAESGSLRMMPPSTGLPMERGAYTGTEADFTYDDGEDTPTGEVNEHELGAHHEATEHTILPPALGMSSEEPAEEASTAEVHHA